MVKDWVLAYPDQARHPKALFSSGTQKRAADLERMVLSSGLTCELALSGTRQNGGFGPVPSRQILDSWIDAYNRLYPEMDERQRKHITAVYLLMAYTHAGEDYMPMIPMLSGHPNFLSDVKSVPAAMAFLFPDHPQASAWADEWEKFVELNTRYHTRPPVDAWDARGGRWTENLGTYVWGFPVLIVGLVDDVAVIRGREGAVGRGGEDRGAVGVGGGEPIVGIAVGVKEGLLTAGRP